MWNTRWISGPAPLIAMSTSARVARSCVAISSPRPGGVDEGDAPEIEHELARVVREHAVQHGLQREGRGHVEVARQAELDAVPAGVLVDREVGHPRLAFPSGEDATGAAT